MAYWNKKNGVAAAIKSDAPTKKYGSAVHSGCAAPSKAAAGLVAAAGGVEKVAKSAENIKKSVGNLTGQNQLKNALDAPISKDASGTKED